MMVNGFRLALAGLGALAALSLASADERAAPLFNGKDTAGWRVWLDPKAKTTAPAAEVFAVRDGVLVIRGDVPGFLATEREYGDYRLTLQWKWGKGLYGKRRNSGILVHSSGPDAVWPRSVEAQLAENNAGDLWAVSGFKLEGDAARLNPKNGRQYYRSAKDLEKPLGEWNRYEIVCKGDTVTLAVNGTECNRAEKLERSKGYILIQSEGAEIHLRDIQLVPLSE